MAPPTPTVDDRVRAAISEAVERIVLAVAETTPAPNSPTTTRLLTIREATAALRISRATLYRYLNRGDLRRVKVGQRVLIPQADVQRIVDEGGLPAVPGR